MKYFLVAGEASGDLHASYLMQALKKKDTEAEFRFFGGDLMQKESDHLLLHYREMAYMGFVPVALHLRKILRNMKLCREAIAEFKPDRVVLVDYPGFNLRIAKYVHEKLHIPVYYYISPTVWAWKKGRIKTIAQYVDKMLCILPFETDFYRQNGFDKAYYVGNPTVDAISALDFKKDTVEDFIRDNNLNHKPLIAILAGSRRQEIKDNLPTMLSAASDINDYQCVIAGAPSIDKNYYESVIKRHFPKSETTVKIVFGQTYRLLFHSQAALVTSGTATLESALLRCPQAVCYKTPLKRIAGYIWRHFFKVKYISLVNLIAGREVIKEFFNESFSVENIREELHLLLGNKIRRISVTKGYDEIIEMLGAENVSEKAAEIIFTDFFKNNEIKF